MIKVFFSSRSPIRVDRSPGCVGAASLRGPESFDAALGFGAYSAHRPQRTAPSTAGKRAPFWCEDRRRGEEGRPKGGGNRVDTPGALLCASDGLSSTLCTVRRHIEPTASPLM